MIIIIFNKSCTVPICCCVNIILHSKIVTHNHPTTSAVLTLPENRSQYAHYSDASIWHITNCSIYHHCKQIDGLHKACTTPKLISANITMIIFARISNITTYVQVPPFMRTNRQFSIFPPIHKSLSLSPSLANPFSPVCLHLHSARAYKFRNNHL